MNKNKLKKEKWTLNVDQRIKGVVIKEAKRRGIYPVQFIESLVREKFNPFGHSDIDDEVAYVRKLRKLDSQGSDQAFIEEIRGFRWNSTLPTNLTFASLRENSFFVLFVASW